jgi:hypothetical protein
METVHFVIECPFDESLQIVSVVGNGEAGDLGFGPVIRIARAVRPVAEIKVELTCQPGDVWAVDVALHDATWMVTRFRCEVPADGFRLVWRRHLRKGYEIPHPSRRVGPNVRRGCWSEGVTHSVPAGRRYSRDR